MNRGSDPWLVHARDQLRASMRPRFMNRGSKKSICQVVSIDSGFNEAPIHESGK